MIGLLFVMVSSLWLLSILGIQILSDSRTYTALAATWSAAQREAAFHLTQYAATRDAKDYAEFLQAIQEPEAARRALAEMASSDPNPSVIRAALEESGLDAYGTDVIMRSSSALSRLGFGSPLLRGREGLDGELNRLRDLASLLHAQIAARDPEEVRLEYVLDQIHSTTHRLNDMEAASAHDTSEAARRLRNMVLTILSVAAAGVLVLGAFLTRALFQRAHRSELALRSRNERIRSVVHSLQEVVFQLDLNGNVLFVNDAWTAMTGFSEEETIGRSFMDFTHPAEAQNNRENFELCLESPDADAMIEARCRKRDGGYLWMELRGRATVDDEGRVIGASGTFTNVTARMRAEGELGTRARQQAAVAALGQRGLAGASVAELMDETVEALARDLDVEFTKVLELLPGRADMVLRAAEGWDRTLIGEARISAGRDSQAGYTLISEAPVVVEDLAEETRFSGPDLLLDAKIRSGISVRIMAQGKAFGVLGAHTSEHRQFSEDDVHFLEALANVLSMAIERASAEEVLRASEGRYRELTEHASDGIFICDLDGKFIQVNRRACEMTGYSAEQMLDRSIYDFLPEEGPPDSRPRLDRVKDDQIVLWERQITRKDGTGLPVEVSAKRIRGGLIQALVRDVSERKQAEAALRDREEQLQQAQKMEALGRLAGGIAHDFNNLLTAILGYAGTGLEEALEGDPLRQNLVEIKNAGETASVLTRQLLAFSRKQVLTPAVFDLNEVVAETQSVLQRILGEDIEIETSLEDRLLPIRADRIQFEQVLLNLAVNARDAMPQGGRLSLITIGEPGEDGRVERVMLSVRDSGTGMDEATQTRIFEPFFTTKGVGQGTGLGLSTVYGIVQQSGGAISVDSAPGRGTSFDISLPADDGPMEPKDIRSIAVHGRGGSETLLLVEDEDMVRSLAAAVLRRSGYHVLEAADGYQALQILQDRPDPVDLLVTDVIMPGMSGRELADRIAAEHPDLRALFLSGYTEDALGEDGVLEEGTAFLQKPFEPAELTSMVRLVLDVTPDAGAAVNAD